MTCEIPSANPPPIPTSTLARGGWSCGAEAKAVARVGLYGPLRVCGTHALYLERRNWVVERDPSYDRRRLIAAAPQMALLLGDALDYLNPDVSVAQGIRTLLARIQGDER